MYEQTSSAWNLGEQGEASPVSFPGTTVCHWWRRHLFSCAAQKVKQPQLRAPGPCAAGTGIRGGKSEAGRRRCWWCTRVRPGAAAGSDGGSSGPEPGWTGAVWAAWRWPRSTERGETGGKTPLLGSQTLPERQKMEIWLIWIFSLRKNWHLIAHSCYQTHKPIPIYCIHIASYLYTSKQEVLFALSYTWSCVPRQPANTSNIHSVWISIVFWSLAAPGGDVWLVRLRWGLRRVHQLVVNCVRLQLDAEQAVVQSSGLSQLWETSLLGLWEWAPHS